MKLRVLFFASSRDIVDGQSALTFEFAPTESEEISVDSSLSAQSPRVTVAQLVQRCVRDYPKLASLLPSVVIALNLEYVPIDSQLELTEKDEIAFIPPISGG